MALYWNRDDCLDGDCLEVNLEGRRPLLVIPAKLDKRNKDRLLPMAPEFAEFLDETPESDLHGRVFELRHRRQQRATMQMQWASEAISRIGKRAGVKVNADTGKCASAHDLRRAFGQRWASRVMPQILMQLMRHEDNSTTMKFYVGKEAEATADVLWEAAKTAGNTLGNTRRKNVKK